MPIKIKLGIQKTGKVLNMKSILVTALALLRAHCFKDTTMSIEYHLRKPSIGIFLWTIITQAFGAIDKNSDAFSSTREKFHREYALPIGQSLGYGGVEHNIHFDKDFFTPYKEVDGGRIYPSIKSHMTSPIEEIKVAYDTLNLMEKRLLFATKNLPELYTQFLKKK